MERLLKSVGGYPPLKNEMKKEKDKGVEIVWIRESIFFYCKLI